MELIAEISGERLDAFLARRGENLSRSAAQKLIEEGQVLRNGKPGCDRVYHPGAEGCGHRGKGHPAGHCVRG